MSPLHEYFVSANRTSPRSAEQIKKEDIFPSTHIKIIGGKSTYFAKTVKISSSLQISASFNKLTIRNRHGQWYTLLRQNFNKCSKDIILQNLFLLRSKTNRNLLTTTTHFARHNISPRILVTTHPKIVSRFIKVLTKLYIFKTKSPGTTSVCFSVLTVNDEHRKPEFKIKRRS